jgi:hypothetical protein
MNIATAIEACTAAGYTVTAPPVAPSKTFAVASSLAGIHTGDFVCVAFKVRQPRQDVWVWTLPNHDRDAFCMAIDAGRITQAHHKTDDGVWLLLAKKVAL